MFGKFGDGPNLYILLQFGVKRNHRMTSYRNQAQWINNMLLTKWTSNRRNVDEISSRANDLFINWKCAKMGLQLYRRRSIEFKYFPVVDVCVELITRKKLKEKKRRRMWDATYCIFDGAVFGRNRFVNQIIFSTICPFVDGILFQDVVVHRGQHSLCRTQLEKSILALTNEQWLRATNPSSDINGWSTNDSAIENFPNRN